MGNSWRSIPLFGTSAKYIDAVRKSGIKPAFLEVSELSALRIICSTGSPLSTDFAFVYDAIKSDVHVNLPPFPRYRHCIMLCFGQPVRPVYAGEIQTAGLGMDVAILDENGQAVDEQQGELCCRKPFPAMPIGFCRMMMVAVTMRILTHIPIFGDTGIRQHVQRPVASLYMVGLMQPLIQVVFVSAQPEIFSKPVEAFEEIAEALVVGQSVSDDVRIILFVRLQTGAKLTETLKNNIKTSIRSQATPRHVPALILEVADIPRTRSGKTRIGCP